MIVSVLSSQTHTAVKGMMQHGGKKALEQFLNMFLVLSSPF